MGLAYSAIRGAARASARANSPAAKEARATAMAEQTRAAAVRAVSQQNDRIVAALAAEQDEENRAREAAGLPAVTALDYARELVGEAVYAPDHVLDVITLTCAITHQIDNLHTAPRILVLGLPGSGKSTVLSVASYLAGSAGAPTGVLAMTGPSYVSEYRLNPKFTPLLDEVHHLFGMAGGNGKSSKFYTYLNGGYNRKTAWGQYQENKVAVHVQIFGVAFMAGLGLACPDDMRERSIVLKMEKPQKGVTVSDFSDEAVRTRFEHAGLSLKYWAESLPPLSVSDVRDLKLHPELVQRKMEVWGPIFAMALAAGGDWLDRAMVAFKRIALDGSVPVYIPEVQLLLDYAAFANQHYGDASIASGEFSTFALAQPHGAYAGLKEGQFRQLAVKRLGLTAPFYDAETRKNKRGWTGQVHRMNLDNAQCEAARVSESPEGMEAPRILEDF